MTHPATLPELRRRLDALARASDGRLLDHDPVGVVRRFEDPRDREIAALLAAGLAYGRVASIRASLDRLFAAIGAHPASFVMAFDPRRDARRLDGFAHRFTRGADVAVLLALVRRAIESAGSLETFFLAGDPDPSSPTLEGAMNAFGERLFALGPALPRGAGARWLLPLPSAGSVAKRHCLFLRWLVRPDDGVDLGLWPRVSRARLVVPLDVHVQRVSQALGWTRRRSPCWAMALEVTARLRGLDPGDPIRYDFGLCHLGVLGHLRARGGRLTARTVHAVLREIAPATGT